MFISIISLIVLSLPSSLSFAQNSSEGFYTVNGQNLQLDNVILREGSPTEGRLATTTDVEFGINKMTSVPAGTSLKISKNSETGTLYISLMIFAEKFEDQDWVAGSDKLRLNCSSHSNQARVVSFYENLQMNGRCVSVAESMISTPDKGRVKLAVGGEVFLTESGALKSTTKVNSGFVYVRDQKVNLHTDSSLDYFQEKLHFLYLAAEESFTVPTMLSPTTIFKQFHGERVLPIIFYPNGSVESGRVHLEGDLSIAPSILGEIHDLKIIDGQMGFDEQGRLDRLILKEEVVLNIEEETTIYFIDIQDRNSIPVTLKAGETLPIPRGTHLFLSYDENQLVLDGFPIITGGQKYFLSLTGSSEVLPGD